MKELEKRLTILKEVGQIGNESFELAFKIIKSLEEKHGIILKEENGSMLVTHIVMANERMISKEKLNPLSDIIKEELNTNPNIELSKEVTNTIIKDFGENFDKTEEDYILMHVCNLVGSLNEDISN